MKYAELVKNIKAKNWYRQGGEMSFFYSFRPYKSIYTLIGYDDCVNTQKGRVNIAYFNKDEETKKAKEIIKEVKNNGNYIDQKIKKWEVLNNKIANLLADKYQKPVEGWTDQELIENLDMITELFLECWKIAVLIECFDPEGDKILKDEIAREGISLSNEEIAILTSPDSPTVQQQEFIDRVKVIQNHKAGKNIDDQVAKHQQKYHWIENNWHNVIELSEKYFWDLIKKDEQLIAEKTQEAKKISEALRSNQQHKKKIITDQKISPQSQNIFHLFSRMAEWRDIRKKSICITNHYFHQILQQLEKVNDIEIELLHFLNLWDINGWKLSPNIEKELEKRQSGIVYLYGPKKTEWYCFYGQEAKSLKNLLDKSLEQAQLTGTCASEGKIEGVVKIVETREDFSKVKPGDIIVATMTRPDYLPIMKIAGGIITEEGGLTCHAAIVSRELEIPCVVGTQTATTVLQDGDKVELNADEGIVEKL